MVIENMFEMIFNGGNKNPQQNVQQFLGSMYTESAKSNSTVAATVTQPPYP